MAFQRRAERAARGWAGPEQVALEKLVVVEKERAAQAMVTRQDLARRWEQGLGPAALRGAMPSLQVGWII